MGHRRVLESWHRGTSVMLWYQYGITIVLSYRDTTMLLARRGRGLDTFCTSHGQPCAGTTTTVGQLYYYLRLPSSSTTATAEEYRLALLLVLLHTATYYLLPATGCSTGRYNDIIIIRCFARVSVSCFGRVGLLCSVIVRMLRGRSFSQCRSVSRRTGGQFDAGQITPRSCARLGGNPMSIPRPDFPSFCEPRKQGLMTTNTTSDYPPVLRKTAG